MSASNPAPAAAAAPPTLDQKYNLAEEKFEDIPERNSTILLIGPTQHGKSTLGNFLVNGVEDDDAVELLPLHFAEGNGNVSETAACQAARAVDEHKHEHVIIDTPGFGDTNERDDLLQLHLAESLMALGQEGYSIGLVVVVVKRDSVNNRDYKELITMYRDLLGSKFMSNNVQIVFTNSSGRGMEQQQKRADRQGKPGPRKAMEAVKAQTAELLGVDADTVPLLFLDALPDDEKDKDHATQMRDLLLKKASKASMLPKEGQIVDFESMPKIPAWVAADRRAATGLEGEMTGCVAAQDTIAENREKLEKQRKDAIQAVKVANDELNENNKWLREYKSSTKEALMYNQTILVKAEGLCFPWMRPGKEFLKGVQFDHPVSSVSVSGGQFFRGGYAIPQHVGGNLNTIKLVLRPGFLWRDKFRNVQVFTTYDHMHKEEIAARTARAPILEEKLINVNDTLVQRIPDAMADLDHEGASIEEQKKGLLERLTTLTNKSMSLTDFRQRCADAHGGEDALFEPLRPSEL